MHHLNNTLHLGNGIYTVPDISAILRLPYHKVNTWLNRYWDGQLGKAFQSKYSWRVDHSRAVNFQTLVEFFLMMHLSQAGVKPKRVLEAHDELSMAYKTAYPFARQEVLEQIQTDGKFIYLKTPHGTVKLDGGKQFHLPFIQDFLIKLDFHKQVASRLWPLGKDKAVVCDPQHKFGQPIIEGTNIETDVIYQLYLAKEPIPFIASLYELPEKKVKEAIFYHKQAA